jgi:type I restriction enzyme S subunit
MQAYPKYDSYQETDVPWIGKIPKGWELKPGFTVLKENNVKNKGMIEETVLSLSYGRVIIKPKEKLTGLVPESFETYQIIEPGDIIFRPTDLQNDVTSLRTGLAKNDGIITSAYIGLKSKSSVSSAYMYYLLHAYDLMKVFYGLGSGLRQNISYVDFKRLPIVLPDKESQTHIAKFLDQKTQEIDAAISKKQQLIELLKEQKIILINHAVIKGLNPNAPMRDSGVEWIGEIPEHWEVKRLKYVLEERNDRSTTGEEPLFMVSQVHGLVVRADYHKKAEVAASSIDNKIVYENDLVFNKLKAHLGVFFKSTIEYEGIVSPDYAVYKSKGLISDLKYLELLFRHQAYIGQFIIRATGIVEGLIRLYTGDLFDIAVPVPPEDELRELLEQITAVPLTFKAAASD